MNPQLDIVVGLGCSARCGFCVQEVTWKPRPGQKPFAERLAQGLEVFRQTGGRRIVITGGEPTQYPRLCEESLNVLSGWNDWEFTALYTNGQKLRPVLLSKLAASGLTDVNLSSHHWDDHKNREVYGLSRDTNHVISTCREAGLQVRLNAVLLTGLVDDLHALFTYLEWAESRGVKDVYFRDLFWFAENQELIASRNPRRDVKEFTAERRINFATLVREIQKEPDIRQIGFRQKNAGHGREWEFLWKDKLPFYLADLTIGREEPDEYPYWVFMPDCNLYRGFTGPRFRMSLPGDEQELTLVR